MNRLKKLIEAYFDTPERKAKLFLLITLGHIWAVIAMIIGVIVFLYLVLKNTGAI